MIKISEFTDITYTVTDQVAVITINRPDRYNALRGRTVDELIYAFRYAYVDKGVAAIILTGAGTKAFCSGGDQKERNETGGYGETEMGMFEIERLHRVIREVPKPALPGTRDQQVLCHRSCARATPPKHLSCLPRCSFAATSAVASGRVGRVSRPTASTPPTSVDSRCWSACGMRRETNRERWRPAND